jgi:hypothetical protein
MRKLCVVGSVMASCLFAGGSLLLSDSVNASEVAMPFYSVGHGNANPVPVDECTLKNHETYTGFALPIGAFTGTEDETVRFLSCSPPSPHGPAFEVSGKFKIVTANKDEIDGELQTTGTLDPVNGVFFQGEYRFVSGTGQFTNIKGSGMVIGHGAPGPPFEFVGTFIGTISYDKEKLSDEK